MEPRVSTAHPPLLRFGSLIIAGAVALGASAVTSIAVHAQDADALGGITTVSDDLGTYLVDGNGLTLYYFVPDSPGASVCEGGCVDAWPLLTVGEDQVPSGDDSVTGTLSFTTRSDGTNQATYRGRPLYYYAGDEGAGDTNGHGVNDVWWVAAEDGSLVNAETPDAPELTLEAASSDLGTFITGVDGLTAYFFTVDGSPGASNCSGDCLDAWPPVTVSDASSVAAGEGVSGVIGSITGNDGAPQVTYDGRPLYYFAGDRAAGDTNGQNVGGVWFVAATDGLLHTE